MPKLAKIALLLLVLLVVTVAGIVVGGYGPQVMIWGMSVFNAPSGPFDPSAAASKPDYSDPVFWAALPDKEDPGDLIPAGIDDADIQGKAPVDVFFIHPTGYLSGASWTSPMDADSAAEENTSWMLANQASAYNGCCNVYAPRYREASIFTYFAASEEEQKKILSFAYEDVAAAFDYFLREYSDDKPFIIASHSQGTHHGVRLLKEKINGTPLAQRMVAAYLIGSAIFPVPQSYFDSMADIGACSHATDLGCVIHWDTFGDGGSRETAAAQESSLCTNPLSWTTEEGRVSADLHQGAVAISVPYNLDLSKENSALGVVFDGLEAPIARHTWAECRDGALFVKDQKGTVFDAMATGGQKNYHGLDYSLFYMDIRNNARARVERYLQAMGGG